MLPTPLQHIALVTVAGHSFKIHLLQPQASVEPFCLLAFLSPFFSQYSERKLLIEKTLISHVKPGWFKSSDNNLFIFPIYLWEMRLRFFWEEGRWWGSAVRGHCLNLDHCSDMYWAIKIPVQTKPGFPCSSPKPLLIPIQQNHFLHHNVIMGHKCVGTHNVIVEPIIEVLSWRNP